MENRKPTKILIDSELNEHPIYETSKFFASSFFFFAYTDFEKHKELGSEEEKMRVQIECPKNITSLIALYLNGATDERLLDTMMKTSSPSLVYKYVDQFGLEDISILIQNQIITSLITINGELFSGILELHEDLLATNELQMLRYQLQQFATDLYPKQLYVHLKNINILHDKVESRFLDWITKSKDQDWLKHYLQYFIEELPLVCLVTLCNSYWGYLTVKPLFKYQNFSQLINWVEPRVFVQQESNPVVTVKSVFQCAPTKGNKMQFKISADIEQLRGSIKCIGIAEAYQWIEIIVQGTYSKVMKYQENVLQLYAISQCEYEFFVGRYAVLESFSILEAEDHNHLTNEIESNETPGRSFVTKLIDPNIESISNVSIHASIIEETVVSLIEDLKVSMETTIRKNIEESLKSILMEVKPVASSTREITFEPRNTDLGLPTIVIDPSGYKTMAELRKDLAANVELPKVVVLNQQGAIVANLSLLSEGKYFYR